MKRGKEIELIFIRTLAIEAAVIAIAIAFKRDVWAAILVYWITLALKNCWDYIKP